MLLNLLLAPLLLATLGTAQLFESEDGDGALLADFPAVCTDSCAAFQSAVGTCSSVGDTDADEAASFACVCTQSNADALSTCASCIFTNTADPTTSSSAAEAEQLAVGMAQSCGLAISVDNAPAALSSALLAANAAVSATSSGEATATGTTTSSKGPSGTSTSTTGTASKTGTTSSSPTSATSASNTSGASFVRLSLGSFTVAGVIAVVFPSL